MYLTCTRFKKLSSLDFRGFIFTSRVGVALLPSEVKILLKKRGVKILSSAVCVGHEALGEKKRGFFTVWFLKTKR